MFTNLGLIASNASSLYATNKKKKRKEKEKDIGQSYQRKSVEKCNSRPINHLRVSLTSGRPIRRLARRWIPPIINYDRATPRSDLRRVRSHAAAVVVLVRPIGLHGGLIKQPRAERKRGTLKEPAVRSQTPSHRLAVCKTHLALRTHFSRSP